MTEVFCAPDGPGAALALPRIDALQVHREMPTFAEANLSDREVRDPLSAARGPTDGPDPRGCA